MPESPTATGANADAEAAVAAALGARLRALRTARGTSARALAAELGISPSAVSQIERGIMRPSVARLIAITDALGAPLSAVFDDADTAPDEAASHVDEASASFALQRAEHSAPLLLDSGVSFRRIAPGATPGVEYFESVYPPGSFAGSGESTMFRHEGYEVGSIVSGELTIDFDDERIVLRPGDTITYPCSRPHHLHNTGTEPVVARWLIVHGQR